MTARNKTNRTPKSSRARIRRLARKQATKLNFEALEPKHMLAAVTVGNATDDGQRDCEHVFHYGVDGQRRRRWNLITRSDRGDQQYLGRGHDHVRQFADGRNDHAGRQPAGH